ncbi:hypothetical protein CVT24_008399, partial [Panaeolus cyanescens]
MAEGFASLARVRLPAPGRLLLNSCCPDKDLIVLLSRLGGTDRLSLWNSQQCSRIWETDVGNEASGSRVVAIAWSPDGQGIALALDPPAVTVHSIQDGKTLLTLPVSKPPLDEDATLSLTGIYWFKDIKQHQKKSKIPDIFKRNDTITGSVHSVLKQLPLLDNLQEDNEKQLTATDLFAFQGSHTRANHKSQLPAIISSWPSLTTDPAITSIDSGASKAPKQDENLDEADPENSVNSVLFVTDNLGRASLYLDGIFPLLPISLGQEIDLMQIVKHPYRTCFLGQPCVTGSHKTSRTSIVPLIVNVPLLGERMLRDLANSSSTARELVWYLMKVVQEMKIAWFGSSNITGAREFGPKWVRSLEDKLRDDFGYKQPNAILELTETLTTGHVSDPLTSFFGSNEQMSERGLQKWETAVGEALIKLRDMSERQVAPALQRVHLVLEQLHAWAKLPAFSVFELSPDTISSSLTLVARGIVMASWLASTARRELSRFKEFIAWLRFEQNNVALPTEPNPIRHDPLEVNNYFMTGLTSSQIDKWFTGAVPHFSMADLGVSEVRGASLSDTLLRARQAASKPLQVEQNIMASELSSVDRNMEALIQELAQQCQRVFHHASGAASRVCRISFDGSSFLEGTREKDEPPKEVAFPFARARTLVDEHGRYSQHTMNNMTCEGNSNLVILTQLRAEVGEGEVASEIGVGLLQCYLPEEDGQGTMDLELVDGEFFDDEWLIIVYRVREGEKKTYIGTVNYKDIGYQNMQNGDYVKKTTREDLMQDVVELWKSGQLATERGEINRRREVVGCREGRVWISVNGRAGRRVGSI